jgi:thiol-disulfide isomerase/thioredoxin
MRSISFFTAIVFFSFARAADKLPVGMHRGVLMLDTVAKVELPFNFEVKREGKREVLIIRNAEERIMVRDLRFSGDSLFIFLPVFDTEFRTVLTANGLRGNWISHYRTSKNIIPFRAEFGSKNRFPEGKKSEENFFEGKWEVCFSPGKSDSSKAIGIFHHQEKTDFITGTFLTESGDYRYLEGIQDGTRLFLSAFDGSHAFLLTGEFRNGTIANGKFYSGMHWQESWSGRRNEKFTLKKGDEIASVKDPGEELNLTFPDEEQKPVSLNEKRFANKPVILQLMGSWCPNCMDEGRYLQQLYSANKSKGLEVIGIAFEKTNDMNVAARQVKKFKAQLGLEYTVLITPGKDKAAEAIPALGKIYAYPTTLYLNRRHQVVKVHTGFDGPATGKAHEDFKKDTALLIERLLLN